MNDDERTLTAERLTRLMADLAALRRDVRGRRMASRELRRLRARVRELERDVEGWQSGARLIERECDLAIERALEGRFYEAFDYVAIARSRARLEQGKPDELDADREKLRMLDRPRSGTKR